MKNFEKFQVEHLEMNELVNVKGGYLETAVALANTVLDVAETIVGWFVSE